MDRDEYLTHDALSLASLVASKKVSPGALLRAAMAQRDRVNPKINAVIHHFDEAAARRAEGPVEGRFGGVPFLVKDLDGALGGAPLCMGSRSLEHFVAPEDSTLFSRYRRAGLNIFGKTNTPEFGILAMTEPALFGPTRNPWHLDHSPCGSSGGSAAAVAAGIVPVAHGGDGGGSIRIPASACGLFGMKPTRGRMPLGPEVGEGWHGFVVPHVLSRSVRDSAAFLDETHGADEGAPYTAPPPRGAFLDAVSRDPKPLRVALCTRSILGNDTAPACVRAAEEATALVASFGHAVEVVALPIAAAELRLAYLTVVAAGTASAVAHAAARTGRSPRPEMFEPTTWFLSQVAHALSAAELEAARDAIARAQRSMGRFFSKYDLLITPTLAHPPSRVGELALKPVEEAGLALLRRAPSRTLLKLTLESLAANSLEKTPNTMLFNMTGQPAMSVPLGASPEGLPIGVQFAAPLGDEELLFSVAGQLERANPWFMKLAPLATSA